MASPTYPTLLSTTTDAASGTGSDPTIRDRIPSDGTSLYQVPIDPVLANTVPGFILELLSQEVWGDPGDWWILGDLNTTIHHPAEWSEATSLQVPNVSSISTLSGS